MNVTCKAKPHGFGEPGWFLLTLEVKMLHPGAWQKGEGGIRCPGQWVLQDWEFLFLPLKREGARTPQASLCMALNVPSSSRQVSEKE
jgi:hypothetical protein